MTTFATLAAALAGLGLTGLGSIVAQSVGVTLSALTPLSVKVTDGGGVTTSTHPVGPLTPAWGTLSAVLPSATIGAALVEWQRVASNQYAAVYLTHSLHNPAGLGTFSGRCGPHEFLVAFTSAVARPATLRVGRQLELSPGAPSPVLQIDFDNDGVIDVSNPSPLVPTIHPVSFGPQPLLVRVVVDATLGAQTGLFDRLVLFLEPDNGLTITQPVAGCSPSAPPPPPLLQTSFDDRGVDLTLFGSPLAPAVLVFGFAPQPALLSMNGALPCIVLPAPDVVLAATGLFHLPLPASVRPVTFFAQGVVLTQLGLRTTEGYAVTAN